MSFDDPNLDTSETGQPAPDPEPQPEQYEPAQSAPQYTPRTYTDADMARARRSYQAEAARRQEAAIAAAQAEWQRQFEEWYSAQGAQQAQQAQPQPEPNSPFSRFDPTVAAELQAGLTQALAPYQQRQAALAQQAEEARAAAKYGPDFLKNRDAVLQFAKENGITTWDVAYRAFKYSDRAQIEREAIGAYVKKKAATSARTPSVESRGGGAPSGRQNFKNREEMDEHVIDTLRRANQS